GNGCRQPYLPAARAAELAVDLYRRIHLPDDWQTALVAGIEEVLRVRHHDQRRADTQVLRRRAQVDRDRQRLLQAFYDEAIDADVRAVDLEPGFEFVAPRFDADVA